MTTPSVLHITFATCEDTLTLAPTVEAKAIDLDTYEPVASLPVKQMADWLRVHGYRHRPGSSGFWERPKAPWYRRAS